MDVAYSCLKHFYGNIIIVEPTVSQRNDFLKRLCDNHEDIHSDENDSFIGLADDDLHLGMDQLKNAIDDAATDESGDALIIGSMGETNPDEHFCDMVVVCGKSFHILVDLKDTEKPYNNSQEGEDQT